MSAGALILMVLVMTVVWGGVVVTLWSAWRQERRRRAHELGKE